MNLARQILDFLELEIFAAELYRQHKKHVPKKLVPLMEAFERVENIHVMRFRELHTLVMHKPSPRGLLPLFLARFAAFILAPFGWRAIFRFECWVEEHAVADYRHALTWVAHADTRAAIQATLADEETHAPYFETLRHFCADEEHHIDVMLEQLERNR